MFSHLANEPAVPTASLQEQLKELIRAAAVVASWTPLESSVKLLQEQMALVAAHSYYQQLLSHQPFNSLTTNNFGKLQYFLYIIFFSLILHLFFSHS